MRTRLFLVLMFVVAMAVWANDKIQPLNTKLGLWEMTVATANMGQMPIPEDVLSKLTPEQQAMVKQRMQAAGGMSGAARTYKSCLTKEKMDSGAAFSEDKTCKPTIITSTGSKFVVNVECDTNGVKGNGTIQFEALDPENVKGTIHMTMTGNGQTRTMDSTVKGKWLAPACGSVN